MKYQVVEVSYNVETKASHQRAIAANLKKGTANELAAIKNRKQDLSEGKVMLSYLALPIS